MVSWGFAFRKGFTILLWSILWCIVGTVIAAIISGGAIVTIMTNWSTYVSPTTGALDFNKLGGPLAMLTVGYFIAMIITAVLILATILKITMETTLEEAKKP